METVDISALTPEQKARMLADLQGEQQAARARAAAKVEDYKKLVTDTVSEVFPSLVEVSRNLAAKKQSIRDAFAAVIELKSELYGTKEGQSSHQFMNKEGTLRIKVGYYLLDNYDDTVEVGIQKVRDYINSLAKDAESRVLVDTILKLLSKDAKGTLKASRVLQLQQMADKSGNVDFVEGVRIIRDAYCPIESKSYVRAEYRDECGVWHNVPLGMTEA